MDSSKSMDLLRDKVNDPSVSSAERLQALSLLVQGGPLWPALKQEVNNHIHSVYSFSPYTPAMAALKAREAGLMAAGSIDHDSIGAAREMLEACQIIGIASTCGFELRVDFEEADSFIASKKINNPDSTGIAYMTIQGVPAQSVALVKAFLAPLNLVRNRRSQAILERINQTLSASGLGLQSLDFERDVVPLSMSKQGGSITERHLCSALALLLMRNFKPGKAIFEALAKLGVEVSAKLQSLLADTTNAHYQYDLIGLLKAGYLERVFIQPAQDECLPVAQVVAFARSLSAIPAYAYLGDVGESPTGDKKAEKFEDDFLDQLFETLVKVGYQAVTYMPPRNTVEQLLRIRRLCEKHGLMEISGVDINSSRQSFNCPEVLQDEFKHLIATTWALIAHEKLASADAQLALFAHDNPLARLSLSQRLSRYAEFGQELDVQAVQKSARTIADRILKEKQE